MKKIRPPLEDVLDSKFFEKIRPRLEGVLFWGEGGAHFFDGGGVYFLAVLFKAYTLGCCGFRVFLKIIRPPLEGVFGFKVLFFK